MRWWRPSVGAVILAIGSTLVAQAADWPTYHGDNTRQGNDSSDPLLASPAPAWTSTALDGTVYGQPVVVGGQVILTTENDSVYSLSAVDGSVQWGTHLGTPRTHNFSCGNINPLGITGTPVIDGGNVYVVAEIEANSTTYHFELASLSLATGSQNWMQIIDPTADPQWPNVAPFEQQRGALLVAAGHVIVPLGGFFGDCGSYHGYVLGFPESGSGSVTYWASTEIPTISADNRGGIWAAGGLSEDAAGFVFASTGNSNQTSSGDTYDYSDGVIKLNPSALSPGAPVDFFAPSAWFTDNINDADLGSTTPLQLPGERVFQLGKTGVGYLLDATNMGHIGQPIASHRVCSATNDAVFGSLAYASGVVYAGCSDGLTAVRINGSNTDFSTIWHNGTDVADHPPTITGGVVWSMATDNSTVLGFDGGSGAVVRRLSTAGATHFTTPTAANNQLYVAAGDRAFAFAGCLGSPLAGTFAGGANAGIALVNQRGVCVMTSNGSAFSAASIWSSVPFFGTRATLSGEIDGDAKTDLIAVNDKSTWVTLSTGTGFSAPSQLSTIPFFGSRATLAGDLNATGRADLIAVNNESTWVAVNTGSGFSAPQEWSATPFYGSVGTFAADIDGDGRVDLVAVNGDSTWVMINLGGSFGQPTEWSTQPFSGSVTTLAADVSGDRFADLVAVDGGSTWVMYSTGHGFTAPVQWSGEPFFGTVGTLAADVNGDSRFDLVAVNGSSTWVMTSTGTGFTAPARWG